MGIYRTGSSGTKLVTKTIYDIGKRETNYGFSSIGQLTGASYLTVPAGKRWRYIGSNIQAGSSSVPDPMLVRLGVDQTKYNRYVASTTDISTSTNYYFYAVDKNQAIGTSLTYTGSAIAPQHGVQTYTFNDYLSSSESSTSLNGLSCQRPTKGTLTYQGIPAELMSAYGRYTTTNLITISIGPLVNKNGVSYVETSMGSQNSAGSLGIATRPAISPNGRWLIYPDYTGTLRVHEINADLSINTTAASTSATGLSISGSQAGASVSPDGTKIAVWSNGTSPYIKVYPFTNSTGAIGTVYSNPGTLPEGPVVAVEWGTGSDFIVYSCTNTPYIGGYPVTSSFGTKFSNPGTIPSAAATQQTESFQRSPAGNYFAVIDSSVVRIYTANNTGFTAYTSASETSAQTLGWNWSGDHIAIGRLTQITTYSWNGSALANQNNSGTFSADSHSQALHLWWSPDWPEYNSSLVQLVRMGAGGAAAYSAWTPRYVANTTAIGDASRWTSHQMSKIHAQTDPTTATARTGIFEPGTKLVAASTGYYEPFATLVFEEFSA